MTVQNREPSAAAQAALEKILRLRGVRIEEDHDRNGFAPRLTRDQIKASIAHEIDDAINAEAGSLIRQGATIRIVREPD